MSFASAATLCAVLCAAGVFGQGVAPKEKPQASTVSLGAGNIDKLSKLVRVYFADLDTDQRKKAKKDLEKLIDETNKAAKAQKISDPLLAVDDWREILRLGLTLEKPPVAVTWRGELKEVSIDSPIDPKADVKELGLVFDRRLKALVSVPADYVKVAYPVIVALHPAEPEPPKGLSSMKKMKEIMDAAKAWATATYSKDVLAKAIVLVPILDCVKRGEDGISFTRPAWDSEDGAEWTFKALSEIVLKSLNYDYKRIYIDGSGSGAAAAADFCCHFPGLQTGAIVRGPLPTDADFESRFENVAGTPILFVGGDAKPIMDKFGAVEGFALERKDTLDDATLLAWLNDHPKNFAPKKIKIRATERKYAASHWLRVTDDDPNQEKEPIFVEAVSDPVKNEITVVTNKKVKAIEIFLNDNVLDLSREVRILHRRVDDQAEPKELFKGVLKRGIEDTLDTSYYRPFCNTGEIYVASRPVEIG
jgi:hypothetical protein